MEIRLGYQGFEIISENGYFLTVNIEIDDKYTITNIVYNYNNITRSISKNIVDNIRYFILIPDGDSWNKSQTMYEKLTFFYTNNIHNITNISTYFGLEEKRYLPIATKDKQKLEYVTIFYIQLSLYLVALSIATELNIPFLHKEIAIDECLLSSNISKNTILFASFSLSDERHIKILGRECSNFCRTFSHIFKDYQHEYKYDHIEILEQFVDISVYVIEKMNATLGTVNIVRPERIITPFSSTFLSNLNKDDDIDNIKLRLSALETLVSQLIIPNINETSESKTSIQKTIPGRI